MRDAILTRITTDAPAAGDTSVAAAAIALDAALTDELSEAETALLREWLRRLATSSA